MDEQLTVRTPSAVQTATGGSFEEELTALLRHRTRLMLGVVFAVALAGTLLWALIGEREPDMPGGLSPWQAYLRFGYLITFALAFALTYVIKDTARHYQLLAFWVVAINMLIGMAVLASVFPDEEPALLAAVCLFVYAVFIPSPARYPAILGVLAVAGFLLSATLTYALVPEAGPYWAELGDGALREHLIEGTFGIAILAFVAHVGSRTLYSLRQTAHQAKRLGNYYVEEELGAGGMGQVFKAKHALIRRPTAVKVMQPTGEGQQAALLRFEREVQLSATLTHPNTITIYDFGRTPDNRFYYAMEYLEGLDLQELVERYGPIPPARAVFILAQACSALGEAHSRGIIHRDIKPSNIFLTQRGGLYDFVKVLDYGLAKDVSAEQGKTLTQTGVAVGTPRYISPEAVKGVDDMDARSDIYCLGAVSYWMLTGKPPFDASSSVELLVDHLKAMPQPPSQVCELPIPAELDGIIMRCLAKDRQDRFPSTAALASVLMQVQLEGEWTFEKAHEWWTLHGLTENHTVSSEAGGELAEPAEGGISRFIYDP